MFWTKVRVLLAALPAQLAAVQSLLTVLAVEVIPLLPEHLAVRAGAIVAVAAGWIATAAAVVSRVTPVSPARQGLLPPP